MMLMTEHMSICSYVEYSTGRGGEKGRDGRDGLESPFLRFLSRLSRLSRLGALPFRFPPRRYAPSAARLLCTAS